MSDRNPNSSSQKTSAESANESEPTANAGWKPSPLVDWLGLLIVGAMILAPLLPWYVYSPPLSSLGGQYFTSGQIVRLKATTLAGVSFWEGGLIAIGSGLLAVGLWMSFILTRVRTRQSPQIQEALQSGITAWGGFVFFVSLLAMADVTAPSSMEELIGGTNPRTGRLSLNPNWFDAGIGLVSTALLGMACLAVSRGPGHGRSTWQHYWDEEQSILQLLAVIGVGLVGFLVPVQWIHGMCLALVTISLFAILLLRLAEGTGIQKAILASAIVCCLAYWWRVTPILSQRLHEGFSGGHTG